MKTKLDILNEIIDSQTYKKVKDIKGRVLIDLVTAQAILLIYNRVND